MGQGNPDNLKPWEPGQSGNPGGRPKTPDDILEMRKISQFEFERIVNRYLFMSPEAVRTDIARQDVTSLEALLGGIIEKAIRKKEHKTAEWILSRTLGKMRERLEIESKSVKVNVQAQASLPSLEQLAIENPDLTPGQLAAFSDKLSKLREEIAGAANFKRVTDGSATLEAEVSEGGDGA